MNENIQLCKTSACQSEKAFLINKLEEANITIHDLKTKIMILEQEKDSLITALKLQQKDYQVCLDLNKQNNKSTELPNTQQIAQKNSKRKQHKDHKEVNSSNSKLFNTENRFQALSDVLDNQTQTETMTKNHQKDNKGKITNEQNECTAQIQHIQNEPLFPPEPSDNNSPSFTSSISILVGDKSLANKTLHDNEIQDATNVGEKHISKAVQVERIEQGYVAEASEASNDPKKRNLDGSEQSSKAGRKEQSYRQSRNVRQTKDNHGSSQDRNSPNDASILLIGDSIIKNIDPRKMSRRRTVKICLPGKRAEQITAEVKSIPVINPSHVIIYMQERIISQRTVNMNVLNTLKI